MTRPVLLIAMLALACRREEPLYDGEPLGYWIKEAKQVSFFSFWNSTKDERRHNAFRRLKAIGAPAVPALVKLFRDENIPVSGDAFNTLANLGPRAASAVPDLIDIVKTHEDPQKRRDAIWILGAIGPAAEPAVAHITPMLRDPDHRARQIAARALGAIGGTGHLVLERGQDSRDPTMRQTAMHGVAARELDAGARQEQIARALADESADVRLTALDLLRSAPRQEIDGIADFLVKALNDSDARVVGAAQQILVGYSQHQVATPRLMATVLNGGEPESQANAAWWLGNSYRHPIGPAFTQSDTFMIRALVDALDAATPKVRLYAARALALGDGETRTRGIAALRREMPQADPILAVRAARVLFQVVRNPAEVQPVYEAGLRDSQKWNRVETISAILEMGVHAELFRDEFRALLNDPDPEVRERAERALHALDVRR